MAQPGPADAALPPPPPPLTTNPYTITLPTWEFENPGRAPVLTTDGPDAIIQKIHDGLDQAFEWAGHVSDAIDNRDNTLAEILNVVKRQSIRIDRLTEELDELRLALGEIRRAPATGAAPLEPKIASPEKYDGTRGVSAHNFLMGLELVFNAQPHRYANDTAKCSFAASLLIKTALTWISPHINDPDYNAHLTTDNNGAPISVPVMGNYALFKERFTAMFGDPFRQQTARNDIMRLYQKTSVTNYIADFMRLSTETGYDGAALVHMFYQGLKGEVKDQFVSIDRTPMNISTLARTADQIDRRIMENKRDQGKSFGTPATNNRFAPRPTAPPSNNYPQRQIATTPARDPNAMDLSATNPNAPPHFTLVDGRVPQTERDRRQKENACFTCGFRDCSSKEHRPGGKKYRQRAAATAIPSHLQDSTHAHISPAASESGKD